MKQYNEHYISCFDEKGYLRILEEKNPYELAMVLNNYTNRYHLDYYKKVEAKLSLYKESLEHYVTKRFLTEDNFKDTELFKNYVNNALIPEINFIIENEYPINNHFLNTINIDKLNNIIEPDLLEKFKEAKNNINNKHDAIINKINENELLTQEELNFICDYYAFNRDKNNENHKLLTKYIFNTLTSLDSNLVANQFVSDAILSYLPKFYKTKDKKRNEHIENIRVLNDNDCLSMGTQFLTHIAIERRQFFEINFENPSHIENFKEYQERSNSFVTYINAVFHELTHTEQRSKLESKEYDEKGFMNIARILLSEKKHDYQNFHDIYQTEIDADQNGWLQSAAFYEEFINDQELKDYLIKNSNKNAAIDHFRRIDAHRYGKKGIKLIDEYEIEQISEKIKTRPELLEEFPMLQIFYKDNGDLNLSFLKQEGLKKTVIGKNFTNYALLHHPEEVKQLTEEATDKSEFSTIVSTLYSAAMNESRRIKNHEFVEVKERYGMVTREPIPDDIFDKLKKQRLNILNNAIDILSSPTIINRETTFFSPITYIEKLSQKTEETIENKEFEVLVPAKK